MPAQLCDSARETAWVFYRGNTDLIHCFIRFYIPQKCKIEVIHTYSESNTDRILLLLPVWKCHSPTFTHVAQPLLQLTQQILTYPPGTPVGQYANSFLLKTSLDYLLKISLDISWFSTQHSRMKINAENCTKEDDFYLQKKNVAYLKVYLLIFMRHVLSKHKSPSRGPRKVERDPRTNIYPWISNTECFAVSI